MSIIATVITASLTSGAVSVAVSKYFERREQNRQTRLLIYQEVVDLFSEFLNDVVYFFEMGRNIPEEKMEEFNRLRMKTYGYLCIYGDQSSIDAHEEYIEYLFSVLEGAEEYDWKEVRKVSMKLLNCFRKDFDPKLPEATYNGKR